MNTENYPEKMIRMYLRHPGKEYIEYDENGDLRKFKTKGSKKGIIIAFPINGGDDICIGYSLCRKGDIFNLNTGLKIALARGKRLMDKNINDVEIPKSILKKIPDFINKRCFKYFKEHNFLDDYSLWVGDIL